MGLVKGMENLEDFERKYPDLYREIFNRGQEAAKGERGNNNTDENSSSIKQRAQTVWNNDSALRSEFKNDFDTFLAFVEGEAAGRIGIVGKSSQKGILGENITKGGDNNTGADLTVKEKAKAKWDSEPALRSEFKNDFDTFLAFAEGEAAGRIKRIGKPRRGIIA